MGTHRGVYVQSWSLGELKGFQCFERVSSAALPARVCFQFGGAKVPA